MALMRPASLAHLKRLTDDTGVFQHAIYSVPRREEGYCSDDNARALVLVAREYARRPTDDVAELAAVYLAFIQHAQGPDGRFRNFMSFERTWIEGEELSCDCQGRCLWGLGEAVASPLPESMRVLARELFTSGLEPGDCAESLRGSAHAILGLERVARSSDPRDAVKRIARHADGLCRALAENEAPDWVWFEGVLTYDNARLPQALIRAGGLGGESRWTEAGLRSLEFLRHKTFRSDIFVPVGCNGWAPRGGEQAMYDQQPIESAAAAEAHLSAYEATGDACHLEAVRKAFAWFEGGNVKGAKLADETRGGACDGLTPDGPNANEGAEATISYLLACQCMERVAELESAEPGANAGRAPDSMPRMS
jgi:hypothetical protein